MTTATTANTTPASTGWRTFFLVAALYDIVLGVGFSSYSIRSLRHSASRCRTTPRTST